MRTTMCIRTDDKVKAQDEEQITHPGLEDLDIDKACTTLEMHLSNLTNEIRDVHVLMDFYRDERNQHQLRAKYQRKRRSEDQMNEQIGIQIDLVAMNQDPDPPLRVHSDYQEIQTKISNPIQISELNISNDSDDIDSIIATIEPADWRC